MAYCVLADVSGLNATRTTYSASTKPTSTQVTGFINEIAAEIDSILAGHYVLTPVTQPASFVAFLAHINALGAAALAEMAQFTEIGGGAVGSSHTPHGQELRALYDAALADLVSGVAVDPNAALSGAAPLAATYLTDNPDNDPYTDGFSDGQQPVFSMGSRLRDF